MNLRPYQQRTLDELWAWFTKHDGGNPIVEAAVGAGKSLMIAALAQRADTEFPGTRILVLVHQKELLEQNVDKLLKIWPRASVGLYSAAIGKKELGYQLTYATIGSIYKYAHKLGRIDIVLADECHLINPKQVGMWRQFISDLMRYNPRTRVVGLTGTPYRGNGVWLTAEEDSLFTHVATKVTMRELVDAGFLTPLVPATTATRIDTSGARIQNGDYVLADLERIANRKSVVTSACAEIVKLAYERKRWLVFAVTIDHAESVANELKRLGVAVDVVSAETPKAERAAIIQGFRTGKLRCLVNVAVLTTGFDVPEVDFIALLRATKSPVLYVQIAGRGMRIADGKTDCLWADFTTTTIEMGPVDAVKGRMPKPKKKREAPFKLCPECGSQNPTAALKCTDCGAEFPPPERVNHDDVVSTAAIMSSQKEATIVRVPVDNVTYRSHVKYGENGRHSVSLRVDYHSGLIIAATEWVFLSHEGYARKKAETWWAIRSKIDAIPGDVAEAVSWLQYDPMILRRPTEILINKSGKYPAIVSYVWAQEEVAA